MSNGNIADVARRGRRFARAPNSTLLHPKPS